MDTEHHIRIYDMVEKQSVLDERGKLCGIYENYIVCQKDNELIFHDYLNKRQYVFKLSGIDPNFDEATHIQVNKTVAGVDYLLIDGYGTYTVSLSQIYRTGQAILFAPVVSTKHNHGTQPDRARPVIVFFICNW